MQGCVIQVILLRSMQYALCLYHKNNGGSTLLRAVVLANHSLDENGHRPLISSLTYESTHYQKHSIMVLSISLN